MLAFSAKPAGRTSRSRGGEGGVTAAGARDPALDAAIGKQISFTDDETISTRARGRQREKEMAGENTVGQHGAADTLQNLRNTCVATSASRTKETQHANVCESD